MVTVASLYHPVDTNVGVQHWKQPMLRHRPKNNRNNHYESRNYLRSWTRYGGWVVGLMPR